MIQRAFRVTLGCLLPICLSTFLYGEDTLRELQTAAVRDGKSPVVYWGTKPEQFSNWTSHSNRLIPVYTFGTRGAGDKIDLSCYLGANSPYRSESALRKIYGKVPVDTLNSQAAYFDQANVGEIQTKALKAGKKHIFLVVFDGMDWQTTFAAATYKAGKVSPEVGRSRGLHFLDYTANGTTQFGMMVTSPQNADTKVNVNTQQVTKPGGVKGGGYDPERGGFFPWSEPAPENVGYPIGQPIKGKPAHAVPDSAGTATTLCTGIKTYNGSINIGRTGEQLTAISHLAQERGMAVGVVSSVPISHATPAAAYAHNVTRNDFQDITRDLLGQPSVSHPVKNLSGVDVLIGAGWGTEKTRDSGQGNNFTPGNRYLTKDTLKQIDVANGGKYRIAMRTPGKSGKDLLNQTAQQAAKEGTRLFGFFGIANAAHLPYRTADGRFDPVPGVKYPLETYSKTDLNENPVLADMTEAALTVLSKNPKGFWLMVEAGDVDWANHDNNLDNSIGAVLSGDDAVRTITDWVETNSNWEESLLILTADHGHYLHIKSPKGLIPTGK